jgi:hypothetical protein
MDFLIRFQAFFGEFERLSNCDKKLLLKSLMPKVIVHVDLRIEIKVNRVFGNLSVDGVLRGSEQVRLEKKMAGKERLELSTNRLTVCCANQLRHFPTHSQKVSIL